MQATISVEACQIIGRQQFEIENRAAEYQKLLGVFKALKDGEITPEQVIVNLETGMWQVLGKVEEPKKNGVPHNRLAKAKG